MVEAMPPQPSTSTSTPPFPPTHTCCSMERRSRSLRRPSASICASCASSRRFSVDSDSRLADMSV